MTTYGDGLILSFQESGKDDDPKYRVKLAFGLAYLSPSALLYAMPLEEQSYVRRDGVMVRDDTLVERAASTNPSILHQKFEMLFGTNSIYLFLRLYTLVCSLLASTRQHQEEAEVEVTYHTPLRKDSDAEMPLPQVKTDYSGVLAALKQVLSKKIDPRDFEALGRRLTKTKVHELAALPKLIERCADSLLAAVKEDCLLHLYDYCKSRPADPVVVRTRCFAVASEAIYRIQRDVQSGEMYFSYLPKTADLLTAPRQDDDKIEDYEGQDAATVPMEEDDPIHEFDESDDRPSKRIRAE
jgi:histone deacetylase complex regulatory component SIN3